MNNYLSTRIWAETVKKLRIIAAVKGKKIVETLDDLVDAEMERMRESGELNEVMGGEKDGKPSNL